ncbi:tellurite resistance TerB family protein [Deinococcus sedimenti]|uniref:Tellurium resistance protein TerB n=1 Tax=Deinococcus sedimenti TaxID=1867090 RepID=A0ABQ2S6X1_9DEIO|nr:tellurite resistance TerB family protein [Deinococcus sedimenti]GGS03639.1 tellurium resistance protein TerB [Deinococcus sedimenti]
MGFLNKLKQLAQDGSAAAQQNIARFQNAAFADATMAACALISAADGSVSPEERRKTAGFIMSSDKLKAFDTNKLRTRYDEYCGKLDTDFDFGKIELMQVVGKIKKPEEARAVIQLAVLIGNADGNFDQHEQKVVRELVFALKLDPNEFGL